jgi:hypothetical protein
VEPGSCFKRLKLMIVLSEHPELAADRDALERIFDI